MQEERALWMQINRGDSRAFEEIYNAHFARVQNFLRIHLGEASVIDDVAQETFLQFWQRPNGFDPDRANLRAYLFGIARKKAADWWRGQNKTGEAAETLSSASDSALLISDALKRLDPDLRDVLWLREVEGYSYDELAGILEIPVGTVKSRLFSAREQLRRVWNSGK